MGSDKVWLCHLTADALRVLPKGCGGWWDKWSHSDSRDIDIILINSELTVELFHVT